MRLDHSAVEGGVRGVRESFHNGSGGQTAAVARLRGGARRQQRFPVQIQTSHRLLKEREDGCPQELKRG